ncbi:MAG: (2Fe-2S)-binding protein, partial [Pseudomonadota bacterium]
MAKDHSATNPVDPISALRETVAVPFEFARAMPTEVYTSPEFVEAELAYIFRKDWYCIGRADALAKAGDYVSCDLAGQPIVVLRDREGGLRA